MNRSYIHHTSAAKFKPKLWASFDEKGRAIPTYLQYLSSRHFLQTPILFSPLPILFSSFDQSIKVPPTASHEIIHLVSPLVLVTATNSSTQLSLPILNLTLPALELPCPRRPVRHSPPVANPGENTKPTGERLYEFSNLSSPRRPSRHIAGYDQLACLAAA